MSDSPDQPPATAMLFEHAADDDAWAVWGLHARWTCKSHVGEQSRTLVIVKNVFCLQTIKISIYEYIFYSRPKAGQPAMVSLPVAYVPGEPSPHPSRPAYDTRRSEQPAVVEFVRPIS
ncbi:MAG: hypothetical protein AB7O62_07055 [Pirellulales bacterium]